MSGGQRQRVALARALVIEPPVLLLDEPLGALDAKLRHDMQIELRALQQHVGMTTIMVTHDQEEAMTLSDRVVLMNLGRIEQIGRPYEMYEQPNGRFVSTFLGKANLFMGRRASADAPVRVGRAGAAGGRRCGGRGRLRGAAGEDALRIRTRGARERHGRGARFLGNYWLFQVATELGNVQVTLPNIGLPEVQEGDTVGLAWSAQHARVLPRGTGAAA